MNPETGTPDTSLLFGLLPKPVAVVFAIILVGGYVISDVAGKLGKLGFLSKAIERRKSSRDQQTTGWRERDRRVEELEESLGIVNGQVDIFRRQVKDLLDRLESQDTELRILHRISDAQYRAIRKHVDWDRKLVVAARDKGIEIDDPPSLYIDIEETDP